MADVVLARALFVAGLLALAASGCSAGDSPPSAKQVSEASVDGLLNLFERECVEQRSLEWARARAKEANFGCGQLFDCEYAEFGHVASWFAPTSTSSSVHITLWWPLGLPDFALGNPPARVTCQFEVADELGETIRTVAERAAERQGLAVLPQHLEDGDSERWIWASADGAAEPQIELYFNPNAKNSPETRQPWDLRYAVFKPGPFIW